MFLKQFVNEGLGNSSYLVGSEETGWAVVIDPQRDVDVYTHEARRAKLRIRYSLETHMHADFVSGSRELAFVSGAVIGASEKGHAEFPHVPLKDGDRLDLGGMYIEVMETPGHSPEHLSFLLFDRGRRTPSLVFSGGALTVGGVARTDLLGHEHAVPLARHAYHSLHDRLLRLADRVLVFPTHGGGSYCVVAQTDDRVTSIGRERRENPLAAVATEHEVIKSVMERLPPFPTYYKWMRQMNVQGPRVFGALPRLQALSPVDFGRKVSDGLAVVDVRPVVSFARGHIAGSYNILLRESFSSWLGWLVPFGKPLAFVVGSRQKREQIVRQCVRIGFDEMAGFLDGGIIAWMAAGHGVEKSGVITAWELKRRLRKSPKAAVLDVREDEEWRSGHIQGAIHIPLGELENRVDELPKGCPISVICSHGIRASAGVSILQRHAFRDADNVLGGTTAWSEAGFPLLAD